MDPTNGSIPRPRSSEERAARAGVSRVRVIRSSGAGPRTRLASETLVLSTVHCTIALVDIEGFGRYSRNNINQVRTRHGMYLAVQEAFEAADIPWTACWREDRGDGVLILAPAHVSKALFVDWLPGALVDGLVRHNRIHPEEEQIRLRLALHAGEINYDDHGVTGSSINHTFRLLEADVLKSALAASSAVLAIIGSAWFFDEVIRHSERSDVTSYRSADVMNKETITQAWIRLIDARVPAPRRHSIASYRTGIRSRRSGGRSGNRRLS